MKTTLRFSTCAMLLLVGVAAHAESGRHPPHNRRRTSARAPVPSAGISIRRHGGHDPHRGPGGRGAAPEDPERTAKASRAAVAKAERRLSSTTVRVNSKADAEEDQVAERLAKEFGMTAEAIRDEQQRLETRWGDVMIAHTIQSNATTALTIDQLYQLKGEGNEWSRIATAMGLSLDELATAVKSEDGSRWVSSRVTARWRSSTAPAPRPVFSRRPRPASTRHGRAPASPPRSTAERTPPRRCPGSGPELRIRIGSVTIGREASGS